MLVFIKKENIKKEGVKICQTRFHKNPTVSF